MTLGTFYMSVELSEPDGWSQSVYFEMPQWLNLFINITVVQKFKRGGKCSVLFQDTITMHPADILTHVEFLMRVEFLILTAC